MKNRKTTVKHKGIVRTWKGDIENWSKHGDVIQHWCDGGQVEYLDVANNWVILKPTENWIPFPAGAEYRAVKNKPKPFEVWQHGCSGSFFVIASCGTVAICLQYFDHFLIDELTLERKVLDDFRDLDINNAILTLANDAQVRQNFINNQ